uniref:Uncharacterized protein n=1 Tax=Aureoumbra lagunensis TaxID=44058 RepID=A0A7S3K4V7_9STRA
MKETHEEKFSEKRKEKRLANAEKNQNLQYLHTYFFTQSKNMCVKYSDELEDATATGQEVLMLIILKSRYKIRTGLELRDWKNVIMMMV